MVEVLGGEGKESPLYKWFVELIICGFLAVRNHMEDIMAMVEPMFHSSLPCFRVCMCAMSAAYVCVYVLCFTYMFVICLMIQ
jgi:phosphatidylinositol kinase/protein kinase (PI-3  family)